MTKKKFGRLACYVGFEIKKGERFGALFEHRGGGWREALRRTRKKINLTKNEN